MPLKALAADKLRRRTKSGALRFKTTDELTPLDVPLGQDRALEALSFGAEMRRDGYNVFVLGPQGTGRHGTVMRMLRDLAGNEAAPDDWVYVYNFEAPHKPNALRLPNGRAIALRHDMLRLVEELRSAVPAVFEGDEYRTRRQAIEQEFQERQEAALTEIGEAAQERGLALIRTPSGFAVAPARNNEVMPPDEFNKLPEETRKKYEADIKELQDRLQQTVRQLPRWDRDRRSQVRELNEEMSRLTVAAAMEELRKAYADVPAVLELFDAVQKDVIDNVEDFLPQEERRQHVPMPARARSPLRRYEVNVMVGDGETGAPVETEELPSQPNLVGRVEHMAEMGALITDFTLIKPGALHRANGGYLVLDALKVLGQPLAWEALKRAIRGRQIKIESPGEMLSMVSTVSLEPEPIPLSVKVVLIGERRLYYLLAAYDPDFPELFKIAADFEEDMSRDAGGERRFARLVRRIVDRDILLPVTADGVALMIEHAARLADDGGRLSLRVAPLADTLREADHIARRGKRPAIGRDDVQAALDAAERRVDRVRARAQQVILEDTVMIDTAGEKVGQINGLAVLGVGGFAFGRPSRITARARLGTGEVIDIERRVELGGPLHSKGVLILSAFLGARFSSDIPLSLQASLVFEQSYGGVDGDSASSTELYALLSALSGLPIRQSLAVTGSVNQYGEVQAIGGVNEKIEGFYDICRARGLTGGQGVLIPKSNVRHLMLRDDVIEACRKGRFAVYPVATIDQGIELLTGVKAGNVRADGSFPPDSVNGRVQKRLAELAEKRRSFGRAAEGRMGRDGNGDKAK